MMQNNKISFFLILIFSLSCFGISDLVLVGNLKPYSGLGKLPLLIINCLKTNVAVRYSSTPGFCELNGIPKNQQKIFKQSFCGFSKFSIFTDILYMRGGTSVNYIPPSIVKFAYSMFESTGIPKQWVKILNNKFDAVLVPNDFLVKVYLDSGVNIPIFVLPCPLNLEDFFNQKNNLKKRNIFTFGMSGGFWHHKNHMKLLEAFSKEFGNNPNFLLKLHGKKTRFTDIDKQLKDKITELRLTNVELIAEELSQQEYINFMQSLDCYVLLSKGEGFSITPREALALEIPCILSNNLAHKTICDSGLVCSVKSDIKEPAYYAYLDKVVGFQYNCEITDVQKALRNVYENYSFYKDLAKKGKCWVKQYTCEMLKNSYLTLVKPKEILLGKENKINENFLITNSENLYHKYLKLKTLN